MSNWAVTDKRIYQLLKHPYQVDKSVVEDMTSAYLEFVEELLNYLNERNDNKDIIRKLNTTQIEFEAIKAFEESLPTDNNKLKIVFLNKLITLIDKELELLYRQMEYPKFFINIKAEWKSPFYLNPEVVNSTDVMEVISGFFNIKNAIQRIDHKEVFFSDFVQTFSKVLNIDFGDIYKKEISVIRRRPNKKTEFLDRLKASIFQKSKAEGYE
ncbi:hypothetical protein HMPREF1981_00240 [Bacteroides pyogenes F0041]|uniref:RteC protein n=1 Tax=Bacteroides pyogenes F0041 TaxID=1321819 RepID=U2CWC7_9BACE|nr:RteC domain-containing protein [Bacteroides pyogenes]ERI88855.1 hypothetical protein HMPREF1981_00240 [Bacteroides pyogenes F0041]MBB3896345.1 hypothetical protein [Bacteroides pyogenes]